jgi:hypothetical protein
MYADADAQAEPVLTGCLRLVLISTDERLGVSGSNSSETGARSRGFHCSMREGGLGQRRRSG